RSRLTGTRRTLDDAPNAFEDDRAAEKIQKIRRSEGSKKLENDRVAEKIQKIRRSEGSRQLEDDRAAENIQKDPEDSEDSKMLASACGGSTDAKRREAHRLGHRRGYEGKSLLSPVARYPFVFAIGLTLARRSLVLFSELNGTNKPKVMCFPSHG